MASLTHVCMWQNNGWKNITADELVVITIMEKKYVNQ